MLLFSSLPSSQRSTLLQLPASPKITLSLPLPDQLPTHYRQQHSFAHRDSTHAFTATLLQCVKRTSDKFHRSAGGGERANANALLPRATAATARSGSTLFNAAPPISSTWLYFSS